MQTKTTPQTKNKPELRDKPEASEMLKPRRVLEVRAISPQFPGGLIRQFEKNEKGDRECEKFMKLLKRINCDRNMPNAKLNIAAARKFNVDTKHNKKVKKANGLPSKLRIVTPLVALPLYKLSVSIQTITL